MQAPRHHCRRRRRPRFASFPTALPAPSRPLPQKKKRTHLPESEDPAKRGQPKSFVFRRGRHGALLRDLEKDLRKASMAWGEHGRLH